MIYDEIKFKAYPFLYDLKFDDRITLVGGDSGTGKTVLYGVLEDLKLTELWEHVGIRTAACQNIQTALDAVNQKRKMEVRRCEC